MDGMRPARCVRCIGDRPSDGPAAEVSAYRIASAAS